MRRTEQPMMGGVSCISDAIKEPGVIWHLGPSQNLVFGKFDGAGSRRGLELLSVSEGACIGAKISNEIEREIWEKFVFLVSLSATTPPCGKRSGRSGGTNRRAASCSM
jgi:2-dehydropantoate 2-reductase